MLLILQGETVDVAALTGATLNTCSLLSPRLAGKVSFLLFRHPLRRGGLRDSEREVHLRAETEELTVNGKKVVVYRWGSGRRPVLLVHGWQSRASRYAGYVDRLRALGLSPISFDAPGHGDSGGRAVTILEYREIIGQLQDRYGPFHSMVAHSFGVTCAFLALRSGIKAERLVAVSGVSDAQFLRDEFCSRLGLNSRLRKDLKRRIEEELFPGTDNIWELFDAKQRTEEIGLPILLIHDEDDRVVDISQAHRLKAAYGDQAELVTTTNLGHRRILGEPAVIDNVVGFLAAARHAGHPVARPLYEAPPVGSGIPGAHGG